MVARLYEVFGGSQNDFPELHELATRYGEARKLYENRKFREAREIFKSLKDEGDHPSEIFYERCLYYMANPPDDKWNSVWIFDHK